MFLGAGPVLATKSAGPGVMTPLDPHKRCHHNVMFHQLSTKKLKEILIDYVPNRYNQYIYHMYLQIDKIQKFNLHRRLLQTFPLVLAKDFPSCLDKGIVSCQKQSFE